MFPTLDFSKISNNVIDFCQVAVGGSITIIAESYSSGPFLNIQLIDASINYLSTIVTWVVGTLTSLVAIKTLSGKSNIHEALVYFKDLLLKPFKKKKKKNGT